MAEHARPKRRRAAGLVPLARALVLVLGLAACTATDSASPTASALPSAAPSVPSASPQPSASPAPTATPEPAFSLDLPTTTDAREVRVTVTPRVPADGVGALDVAVVSVSDTRIDELVLRWSTDLRDVVLLAPFEPAEARIVDGGPPLLQDWTKWVEGPGERGEPPGTTSLGWGPLDPGATLDFSLVATRRAAGAISFDLQLLAEESLLHLEGGEPAELRVDIP